MNIIVTNSLLSFFCPFIETKIKNQLFSKLILITLKLGYIKNKLYKTLDYCSRDILNFDFIENGLGVVSPPHFVYDISTKMFLVIFY